MLTSQDVNGQTSIHLTAREGHLEFVTSILSIDPNFVMLQNKEGESAFHLASREGHSAVAEIFLKINSSSAALIGKDGRMILYYAADSGQQELVEILLRADLTSKPDLMGNIVLHLVARGRHSMMIRLLIDINMNVATNVNKKGDTTLYNACEIGYEDMIKILLSIMSPGKPSIFWRSSYQKPH